MFRLNADMTYPSLQALSIIVGAAIVLLLIGKILGLTARKTMENDLLALFLMCCIVAPCAEELIFRFPLLLILKWSDSNTVLMSAIVVSSVIFGIIHVLVLKEADFGGALIVFFLITTLAFALSRLTVQTGSVIPAMIVHASYNFLLISYKIVAEEFRLPLTPGAVFYLVGILFPRKN